MRTPSSSTTHGATTPAWRSRWPACRPTTTRPTPIGIFRAVERPDYGTGISQQLMAAAERKGPGELSALLRSNGTWSVG